MLNYDVNNADLPAELPPPNEWMVQINLTLPPTKNAIFSARLYITIKRDGNIGATG